MNTLTTYATAAATDETALQRIIKGMRQAGWQPVRYSDGEEVTAIPTVYAAARLAQDMMATEHAWLYWAKKEGHTTYKGTMYFVFGNSPWEVMANSTCGVEPWDTDLKAVETAINLEGV